MVAEPLVIQLALPESARRAGGELLSLIDKDGIEFVAAFWFFADEDESWRLCLATPAVQSVGPIEVYRIIQRRLYEMPEEKRGGIELTDIAVISPNNLIVENLRRRYGVVTGEDGRRVRRVDGPYIYRIAANV